MAIGMSLVDVYLLGLFRSRCLADNFDFFPGSINSIFSLFPRDAVRNRCVVVTKDHLHIVMQYIRIMENVNITIESLPWLSCFVKSFFFFCYGIKANETHYLRRQSRDTLGKQNVLSLYISC